MSILGCKLHHRRVIWGADAVVRAWPVSLFFFCFSVFPLPAIPLTILSVFFVPQLENPPRQEGRWNLPIILCLSTLTISLVWVHMLKGPEVYLANKYSSLSSPMCGWGLNAVARAPKRIRGQAGRWVFRPIGNLRGCLLPTWQILASLIKFSYQTPCTSSGVTELVLCCEMRLPWNSDLYEGLQDFKEPRPRS